LRKQKPDNFKKRQKASVGRMKGGSTNGERLRRSNKDGRIYSVTASEAMNRLKQTEFPMDNIEKLLRQNLSGREQNDRVIELQTLFLKTPVHLC
jgi:hypothetical protein